MTQEGVQAETGVIHLTLMTPIFGVVTGKNELILVVLPCEVFILQGTDIVIQYFLYHPLMLQARVKFLIIIVQLEVTLRLGCFGFAEI